MGAKLKQGRVPYPERASAEVDPVTERERATRGLPKPTPLQPKLGPDKTQTGILTYSDVPVTYREVDEGSNIIVSQRVGPLVVKGTLAQAMHARKEAIDANQRMHEIGGLGAVIVHLVGVGEYDPDNEATLEQSTCTGLGLMAHEMTAEVAPQTPAEEPSDGAKVYVFPVKGIALNSTLSSELGNASGM